MFRRRLASSHALGFCLAALLAATPARAAELQVLAAGAVKSVIPKLAESFESQTGNKVTAVVKKGRVVLDRRPA